MNATESGFEIPSHLDSPHFRNQLTNQFLPAIERTLRYAGQERKIFPQTGDFHALVDFSAAEKGAPESAIAVKKTELQSGSIHWTGHILAYDFGGVTKTAILTQATLGDSNENGKRAIALLSITKTYEATVANQKQVSLQAKGAQCVWMMKDGPTHRGISIAVERGDKDDEFTAKVKEVTSPPYAEVGDLFWYNRLGLMKGHYAAPSIRKGLPPEQVIMSFDLKSATDLMERMRPDGPIGTVHDAGAFFRFVSEAFRESAGTA